MTVRSVRKPPKTRVFRSAGGRRKYKLVQLKTAKREVIIVAKTKNRKKAVDQDEIEEIEALEELEELEDEEEDEEDEDVVAEEDDDEDEDDEDEPEDEEEEDEDEEDEEPAPKRARKSKKGKTKSKKSRTDNGKIGTAELAEHLGVDGRSLRMLLRKHEIPPDPDSGRYQWPSLENKTVKRIEKLVKSGEHKKAQREGLDKLKASKGKKTSSKGTKTKTKGTKSSKGGKKKKSHA